MASPVLAEIIFQARSHSIRTLQNSVSLCQPVDFNSWAATLFFLNTVISCKPGGRTSLAGPTGWQVHDFFLSLGRQETIAFDDNFLADLSDFLNSPTRRIEALVRSLVYP